MKPLVNAVDGPILYGRNLRVVFGQTVALRNVDIDVFPGEILAVMGPSGSGKSTLLHVMAGVILAEAGTVSYNGANMDQLGDDRRSSLRLTDFGFVFQFGQLLPELSALDNVTIPLLLNGTRRKIAIAEARIWLTRMGLEQHADKLPAELSGGQAQRVAIARALVTRPRIVFADEPTGSLDSLSAENIMLTLTELARTTGTTVVIITHDPLTASYADREIVVRDGRIVSGVPSTVVSA